MENETMGSRHCLSNEKDNSIDFRAILNNSSHAIEIEDKDGFQDR